MDSNFNPEQFLGAALTAPLTKRPPADAGRPYFATVQTPKIRPWSSEKGGVSRAGFAADIALEIQLPPDVATKVGQEKITLTDSVFLDTTDAGGLDMSPGKNRGLRRYYDATGLNKPGTTMGHLAGQMVKCVLKHEVAKDGSGDIYERIDGITRA
jgi:hypothetical protein